MFARTMVLTFGSLALVSLGLPSSPVVTTVEAQAAGYRFQEMDRNNDRTITRDEWRGSNRSFEVHDWNGDGRLSGEEIRIGGRQSSNWEEADHSPNWRERNLSYTEGSFRNLDHNRDGRLSSNEWHYQFETFHRMDRNRDNQVTLAEFLGQNVDDDRGDNFDDLDWNNDGYVARNEWHGGNNEFQALDRNRDGRLSRYEVAGNETSFDTYNEFQNLDYDRNGQLSRAEWHWSNTSFNNTDTNRDGIISRAEFDRSGGAPGTVGAITGQATAAVTVNSQQRWTDSGITVRAGDVITFQASGQIQMSDNAADLANPAGSTTGRTAPDAPVQGRLAGGLLMRIGNYSPTFVGNAGTITAPVGGRVYLSVNDDYLLDNKGAFSVQIGIQRR